MGRQASEIWKTIISLAENRLALFSLELREERDFILNLLVLGVGSAILFCFFLGMLGVAIVLFMPPIHRGWAALGIAALYFVLAALTFYNLRKSFQSKGEPFEATRQELKKDFE